MEKTGTRYITVDDLKDRLSISRNHAYRVANDGSLETVKIGRSLRVSEESLIHWLESLSNPRADGGDGMR